MVVVKIDHRDLCTSCTDALNSSEGSQSKKDRQRQTHKADQCKPQVRHSGSHKFLSVTWKFWLDHDHKRWEDPRWGGCLTLPQNQAFFQAKTTEKPCEILEGANRDAGADSPTSETQSLNKTTFSTPSGGSGGLRETGSHLSAKRSVLSRSKPVYWLSSGFNFSNNVNFSWKIKVTFLIYSFIHSFFNFYGKFWVTSDKFGWVAKPQDTAKNQTGRKLTLRVCLCVQRRIFPDGLFAFWQW